MNQHVAKLIALYEERERALNKTIEAAHVQITLHRNHLQWTIDYRLVKAWQKELIKWKEKFTMINMTNGEQIWPRYDDVEHPRTIREACRLLEEGKPIAIPDVIQL